MVIDYRERKAVTKNRPKKKPVNLVGVIVFFSVFISFGAGLFAGWLLFRPSKTPPRPVPAREAAATPSPTAPGAQQPMKAHPGIDPPLTFYETLSKGNSNALIGSGINPRKPPEVTAPRPVAGSHAVSPVPGAAAHVPAAEVKSVPAIQIHSPGIDKGPSGTTQGEGGKLPAAAAGKGAATYTVQVASYKERKEAEAAAARMTDKGLAAYIVESKVPDKGVWYRVRIGRHLDHQSAADLAGRAGKGAVAVAE